MIRKGKRNVKSEEENAFAKIRMEYLVLLGAFIMLMIIGGFFIPNFWTEGYQKELFKRAAIVGTLAIGQTIVMLTGGVDLSIGSLTMGLAVIGAVLFRETPILSECPWWIPTLIIFLIGALTGSVNGLGIALAKIPPIIMTLGMMTTISGITLVYTKGFARGGAHPVIIEFVRVSEIIGIPSVVIMWVIVTLIMWFVLRFTTYGREIYAVGSNPIASHFAGVHVKKIIVIVYTLAGIFAAASSLLYLGRVLAPNLSVAPAGIGLDFLLSSFAVSVLGGTTFRGGEGGVIGTFIAALLYGNIRGILVALGFGTPGILIFTGLIILMVSVIKQMKIKK
ncbi:MAG: ABC transporter permease [Candidatus Bathyarchaeia archaeon]